MSSPQTSCTPTYNTGQVYTSDLIMFMNTSQVMWGIFLGSWTFRSIYCVSSEDHRPQPFTYNGLTNANGTSGMRWPLGLMDTSQGCTRGLIILMGINGGVSDDLLQIIDLNCRYYTRWISVRHVWDMFLKLNHRWPVTSTQGVSWKPH